MNKFIITLVFTIFTLSLFSQTGIAPSGLGTEASPYLITSWQNLYWVSQNSSSWDKHFLQTADIDFSTASPAINTWNSNQGWTPIGNSAITFTGIYDAGGYKVINLYMNYPGNGEPTSVVEAQALPGNIGLFGYLECSSSADAVIRNLGILNADITGGRATGSLLGRAQLPSNASFTTIVENCYTAGTITVRGFGATGGLVGANNSQKKNMVPIIRYCYSNADVESRFPTNTIQNPNDNDELFNIKYGGLVGCNENGLSMDSYSTGDVYGGKRTGGIAGCSIRGAVIRCYATGQIRTGFQSPPFTSDTDPFIGGIVGRIDGQLPPGLGGFQGSGAIQMCYWDTSTSGNSTSGGGTGVQGLTTAQLQTQSTYANWNFDGVWLISANQYPRLGWQDGVNINPLSNTYEGMLIPTIIVDVAQPDQLYSASSIGGETVYVGFMPASDETVNVSIYSTYSENPTFVEGNFPNPENLGAYWQFYCSDDQVLRNAQHLDIQMPVQYTEIWYRYSRDSSEIQSWQKVPVGVSTYLSGSYIYRITVSGLSLPAPGRSSEQGEVEFAGDIGGDDTLPIELSSFTASQMQSDLASINWSTASESAMLGYYVLRNTESDIQHALRITPDIIPAYNSSSGSNYETTDSDVSIGETYHYWLESIEMSGNNKLYGPVILTISDDDYKEDIPEVIAVTEIQSIYPNPFNPQTTIRYFLQDDSEVKLSIYNIKGEKIRVFDKGIQTGGQHHEILWDGIDEKGSETSSGTYIFQLNAGKVKYSQKAVMLK